MGTFDRLNSKTIPPRYAAVHLAFTDKEAAAIRTTLDRYAAIANEEAPEGTSVIVPEKAIDAITAKALAEYVEDLMRELDECEPEEMLMIMDQAIKAQMKAYAVHNLPVYLFQVGGMFELLGDDASAKEFFGLFLRMQEEFRPDRIDTIFLNSTHFDMPRVIALAREKIR